MRHSPHSIGLQRMKITHLVGTILACSGNSILRRSVVAPSEPETGVFRSERQKSRYNKRKMVVGNLNNTREELFAGEFEG